LAPLAASVLIFSLAACGSDDHAGSSATVGDITVTDAWVRQPADGQTASAAYGTITNNGDTDIALVGGSVPFDATFEIHETLMDDEGVMQMKQRLDGFVIAAGATFELEPGGPHVMMLDIDPADFVDSVDVTLIFDDGTEIVVTAPVRSLDGMEMDMDDEMGDEMGGDMIETTDG